MRYHIKYPRVVNLRIQNSLLLQEPGTEFKFNVLSFIMFNYTPRSGHANDFEADELYRSPVLKIKKEKEKGLFFPLVQILKKIGMMEGTWIGVVSLTSYPPHIFAVQVLRVTSSALSKCGTSRLIFIYSFIVPLWT